jgi:hypothetical protein
MPRLPAGSAARFDRTGHDPVNDETRSRLDGGIRRKAMILGPILSAFLTQLVNFVLQQLVNTFISNMLANMLMQP